MKDTSAGVFVPSKSMFNKVVKKFEKIKKRNYDFLVNTGKKFKEAVFRFTQKMILEE